MRKYKYHYLVLLISIFLIVVMLPLHPVQSQSSLSGFAACRNGANASICSQLFTPFRRPLTNTPNTPTIGGLPFGGGLIAGGLLLGAGDANNYSPNGLTKLKEDSIRDRKVAPFGSYTVEHTGTRGWTGFDGTFSHTESFTDEMRGCDTSIVSNQLFSIINVGSTARTSFTGGGNISAPYMNSGACTITPTDTTPPIPTNKEQLYDSLSQTFQGILSGSLSDSTIDASLSNTGTVTTPRNTTFTVRIPTGVIADRTGRVVGATVAGSTATYGVKNGVLVRGVSGTTNQNDTSFPTIESVPNIEAVNPDTPPTTPPIDDGAFVSPSPGAITPLTFDKPNFLTYSITALSTKFPFDIFSAPPETVALSNECPIYTFFDKPFELCPIKDLFNIIQVPIVIAFIIWSVMTI